jgi:hypothetical protein
MPVAYWQLFMHPPRRRIRDVVALSATDGFPMRREKLVRVGLNEIHRFAVRAC